jgi:nicotinamide riboside kinase
MSPRDTPLPPSTPRLVALLGAESTGKTSLCAALARSLPGLWVPEALRDFCAVERRTPRPEEQAAIARAQAEREARARWQARQLGLHWVLCDTAPLQTAVYSRLLFGDPSLLEAAVDHHRRQYALSLLLEPDLPWVADPGQRDGPQMRAPVHAALRALLDGHALPYRTVAGIEPAARRQAALGALGVLADPPPGGR